MALITIDGIALPDPVTYSVPMQDVCGNSIYNEDGELFRDRVRCGVVSLNLAWTATGEQAEIILSAISPEKVSATYFDPRINGYRTADMCVSDRSCDLIKFSGDDSDLNLWSIGFSLTQF